MSLIEAQGISKNFGPIYALKDISLKIMTGKITALLGPSGSGKSTLLRIMAGLEIPSSGTILYNNVGIDNRNRHNLRLKSTMVFQKTVFFSTTVLKNIALGLKFRNEEGRGIEDKVNKVLKLVRMDSFARRSAKKLSGGEQQRISLARALVIEPELLLLDEPTANLDIANAMMIEEIIKDLEGNTTIVVATHNIHQARRLSKQAAILFQGSLVEQGETEEVLSNPKDIRTRKFINGEFYF